MTSDGFTSGDPLYKMVARAFSQDPRPDKVLVGRLSNTYTQTIKWTPTILTSGYTQSITVEVDGEEATAEYTNGPYIKAATILNAGDILNISGHTFRNDDVVTLTSLVGGAGLAVLTTYHVISVVDGVSLQLSATQGGSAIVITTDGTANVNLASLAAINVIDGMVTALQALDDFDTDITVTNQTTYVRVVSTAGLLVGYSDWTGTYEDVTTDVSGGIDAQLDAIKLENDDWYGLALAPACKAMQETAATWIEANQKLFALRSSDWQAMNSSETSDIGDVLMGLSYARSTVYFRKHATSDFIDIGAMAERFPSDPGQPPGAGGTWFGKTIKGVLADDARDNALTPTEKANLRAKNYTVYENTSQRSHTLDGKSASGEFVDVTRFLDWVRVRIQEAIATVELNAERVPYTDGGIASLAAQVSKIMDLGVIAGGFSNSPYPTVTAPKAADVPTADKTARTLNNVRWAATLAGAIHLTNVSGTASV